MRRDSIKRGIITFWNLTDSHLPTLRKSFEDEGMADLLPETVTPTAALRSAMAEVFPECLIRRLDRQGFCAVDEARGETANAYNARTSAWLEGEAGTEPTVVTDASMSPDHALRLFGAYYASRDVIPGAALGSILSKIVTDRLRGAALRQSGGVYWLRDDRETAWRFVAKAVEAAAVPVSPGKGNGSCVYTIHHEIGTDEARAVEAAIIKEMTESAERIGQEIESAELGAKALAGKEREARELLVKTHEYEEMLGRSMARVRQALETVETAAAQAVLMQAAELLTA
jgi:hypothetical protein